jgi:oxidase EvaA
MDTRTVISGIPLIFSQFVEKDYQYLKSLFNDVSLFNSIFKTDPLSDLSKIYFCMNNYKMFNDINISLIPLNELKESWYINEFGIESKKQNNFSVHFYDIEISNREVKHWVQPLFVATGIATFGLITQVRNGVKKILVKVTPEIGDFDKIELGPTIQREFVNNNVSDIVDDLFDERINQGKGIIKNVILSEEGGRFYHEQNKNIILQIDSNTEVDLPPGYLWVNFSTLNYLIQVNNCLNIQLRNLLSLFNI